AATSRPRGRPSTRPTTRSSPSARVRSPVCSSSHSDERDRTRAMTHTEHAHQYTPATVPARTAINVICARRTPRPAGLPTADGTWGLDRPPAYRGRPPGEEGG